MRTVQRQSRILGVAGALAVGVAVLSGCGSSGSTAPAEPSASRQAEGASAASCASGGACAVGDIGPGGGTVFYAASSPQSWGQYLEAAPASWAGGSKEPSAPWCAAATLPNLSSAGTDIGAGAANTAMIVKECGDSSAASKAAAYQGGGLAGWFLPSKDELDALWKITDGGDVRDTDIYWSSSQSGDNAGLAWGQSFTTGYQLDGKKTGAGLVRPVRAF